MDKFQNVIYIIQNLINGKSYIGQAKWFYGRLVANGSFSHYSTYVSYCKSKDNDRVLYRALDKYKSRNFDVSILEFTTKDLMNERECFWIRELKTCIYDLNCNGYNMTWGRRGL